MQVHSARGPRDRPSSAPGAGLSGRRPKRRASGVEGHARGEDVRDADTDADAEVLAVQGSGKRRVKFMEGASNFAPRGSAQQAARFARQQCQHRLQVATTLRRGDRLSPRSAKLYRPSSAQVNFQRSPGGNLQVLYPPTTEVLSMVRKFDEEEPEVDQEALAEQAAEAEAEETPTETASTGGGVQDLDIHLRNIWFMYQEQEEAADEKDKALLHALRGPDQEDREEALLNEMKLLKTGEDAIAFFAKHGDQSDLQVIHCVSAHEEEGKFRPYDLVVVDEKEKGNEYFMISPKGIVHVSPGKQSEHTTLTSWMHQVMIFTVLVSMSFFRNYLTGTAFQRWRSGASNQIYAKHRQSLSRRLFLAKPIFADAQVKVHEILRSLSFTRLLALDGHHNSMGALELRPFLVQQRELCDRADLDTTAEAAREVLDDAIKKVMNSAELFNQEDPKLLKMLSGRNVSVFAKRQAAEREAYRQKLCAFNKSLVGSFVRLVDVIQQSCLVDLAASKACSLLERFARTSKLFLVSPTFGEAKTSGDEKGIPLGLEPGKKDFQEGMQQVLEQIVAVCKVPNVTSYRKYMRHFKQDPAPAIPTDVIHNNPVFRTTLQGLMKQIESDFEKAHQFGESHFAVVYKIHLHSLSWDTDAFGRAKHTHDTLARGMSEMQVFDKHLQKLTTKHPVGFLSIEVTALRDAMVTHVKLSVKAMQSKLSELALETCKKAAVRYHEVNQKLQERPKNLEQLVEYVRSFKRIGGEVADLEALKTSVEDMYATLAQHNIRSAPADDFQKDLMSQRAMTFENDAMPGAQFFVNEQEDSACTEVASRYNAAEQEVEDLQDEIIGGMAADPTFLPEAPQVQKYLDEVGNKLDQFEDTFKYLNDCYVLFMQEPGDVDMLEEAQGTWKKRYELWGIAVQWLNTTARISSESLVRVDVSKIRCQLQGFLQVLGVLSEDLATDAVVLELLDTVDAWFAHRVPVLAIMTGPAMGPQHWTQVVGSFSDAESIKVNSLDFILSGGVMSEKGRKNLTNASAKAAEEHSLLTTLRTIVEAWEHVEMELKEPEDAEAPWLLQSQDDMLDLLYEDITALQQVLKSPTSAIQTEAREISGKLGHACDVLKDFSLLQEQYSLLEPLFRLKVLGEDEASDRVVEKFNASDEAWRLLMHRAQTTCKTVLLFTGQSTMPKQLQRIWEGVNLASEAVDRLLEKQRQQYPRLWFLTDSDLTKALSAVQKLAGPAETEELQGQTEAKAVDVAAGKTLAAFATHFFPWIDKATTWLGPDDGGQNRKARRRSSAGHMMREEVDRALNRKAIGDLDIQLIALKPPPPHSAPENEDTHERPKAKAPVQAERLATEVKSALMGPIQAKPRPFSGPAHAHVHHPHPHGLTSIMDDVAARIGEQVDGHGTAEQFTEMQGHQGVCFGSQRWEWARNLVLTSNEELHLSWPAWCCGRGALLGNWLLAAEKAMQEFLQMQIKQVFKKICESNLVDAVSEWLNEGEGVPGQALLLGLQLFFMNAMEISMDVEDEAGVAMVFGQVDEMLEGLQQALPRLLSMPSLPNTRRLVLSNCWLQALNWQEQLSALKKAWKGAKTRESFQWKRFLRQRWDVESATVVVACVDWSIPYGYEYVGSATAFVRTPQTDRAFVSFASALRQGHAAIGLEGPPASGKVEMVSELARAVAVPLVKAAGTLNVVGMLQFLASVATTNAWGFMRTSYPGETSVIDCKTLTLLATMADALQTLLSAARANKQEVRLGPYEVRCTRRPKAFFFILPSLSDLPSSLVVELRPITTTQPPLGRVVEVLLQVEGFEPEVAERFANGLLSKAHELVIAGSGQQNLQSCGLRRLRHAVAAAGKARRRDATMADTVLSAVLALSPGEGSLHRRSLLGAEGNAVLTAQSQLVSLLAEGEEPPSEEPLASPEAQRLAREVETFCKDFGLSPGRKYQSVDAEEGSSRLALAAVEVYEHVSNGRATVLMGPACSGKSTLLKAMQAASCQGDPLERPQRAKELCLWYVYPQALADEEGGAGELTFQKMMSCLLRTIAERDGGGAEGEAISQQQNLIVFDVEVDERWSDDVWPLLSTRQTSSTEGVYTQLPLSAELLFETRSLEKASPAFCSQCALCPVQEMLDIQNLLEAFAHRIENGFAGKAARFHSSTLLGWLTRLASGINADLKGAQMASHLVNGELQRCTAEDVPRLIEEIRQFCKTGSDMGLQCLGPITQDLLTLADGELALEEIDDSLRGATDIKVEKKLMQVASPSGAVEVPKARAFRRRGENEPVKYDGATRLAFILCLSPTSNADWFRRQLARFTSLGSKISPVWIQPWSGDAYFEVARTSFACELEGTADKQADSIYQNMATAAMQMAQVAVGEIGSQRQLPGGCALYISVVLAAKQLFKAKEEELQKENNRLTNVVEVLVQMEKTLRHFETKHGMAFQQVKESDKMNKDSATELEKVETQAIQASDKVKTLNVEAQEIEQEVKQYTLVVEDATAVVKQNLAMAGLKLRGLASSSIHECRSARQPSAALERVTFATLSALEIEESWTNVVKLLLTDFITRLEEVDVCTSTERAALVHERLEELQALGGLVDEPGRVLGEALAEWLHAFVASVRTWKSVEDDVATLKKAEGCYQQKVKEVESAEEALEALTDQILDIKQQIQTRQSDRAKARGSIQYSNEELDGVASIREFVSCDEVLAWHTRHKDMDRQMAQLPGKFLLGSFLAHYGCFLKEKKDDVLAQWQTICEQEELVEADEHELSADRLLYMMAESCKVQDLELPDGSVGHFPVQLAASLFCSRRPVPLLLDPLGIARQWLDKQLPVMTASICSEITLTSCLGSHPMEDIQAARKSKSSSLLICLGEDFSKVDDDPPQLHPALQSWLQSQKDLPPGQLFLLSNGTRAPKSYEHVGFVINCCDLQALQEYILAETLEIADGQLFRVLGEATNKQWMALSNEKTLNEDMLTKVAADREHTIPLDVALAQEMLKMKQHHVEYAEEQKAAAKALDEMQGQILPWRRFAAKAASIVEVAMAVEKWHPLYQGEGQSCLQWLWHYLRNAVSDKIPVDELTTELPRAWVAAAVSHTFPKHHPSLVCSVAFATNSRSRLEGIFSAALRRSANGEDESEEKEATNPQRDDTLEDLEESQQDDREPSTRPAAPAECVGFITDKGWSRLTDYKDAFADLWKVFDSMVQEPARWTHLKANPEEALPVEIGPVEELLTFAALAPERLEEKLLHLSIKELGTRGVETLSASKGPVALVTQAVQDARSDSPPKPILFLTEEEPGFDCASTVRMTLQSLAAQMDVPFQAVSLLDPLCAAQVGAAHLRFQDQQAGWLLLEDTLDESLRTLETRHPQLLKRLDAMMDLAGKASRSSAGSHLGPPVLVAVHYAYRPQKPTSFCSLLHLVPKANRFAARRVFVSWPVGLMANIRAVEADIKSVKDAEPEHETTHDNLSHLSSLHALLQHRSRMGEFDATNSSWLLEKGTLSHKADPQQEQKLDIASLCKDVLSNSWPANLWAVLPEKLASDLESLGWRSLQQAMQEALQKHQRKRKKRTSRPTNRASERRMYSLCWRSQSASLPDRRFGARLLEDVALVTDSRL